MASVNQPAVTAISSFGTYAAPYPFGMEFREGGIAIDVPGVGELRVSVVARREELGAEIWIDHADPRIWVTDEALKQMWDSPVCEVEGGGPEPLVLRINAKNRSVTYRSIHHDWVRLAWLMEWPD